jgi:secreted trypsin-like serine protease
VAPQSKLKKTKYALVSSQLILNPDVMPSIVGGTEVNYEQIPHQTHLLIDNMFLCGGALISTKCVATAAHCVHK